VALRVRWVLSDRLNGRLPASNEPMALALFQAATVFRLGMDGPRSSGPIGG